MRFDGHKIDFPGDFVFFLVFCFIIFVGIHQSTIQECLAWLRSKGHGLAAATEQQQSEQRKIIEHPHMNPFAPLFDARRILKPKQGQEGSWGNEWWWWPIILPLYAADRFSVSTAVVGTLTLLLNSGVGALRALSANCTQRFDTCGSSATGYHHRCCFGGRNKKLSARQNFQ